MSDAEAPDAPSHAAPRRRGRTALAVIGVVVAVLAAAAAGALAGRATAPAAAPEVVDSSTPVMEESPQAEPLPVGMASGSASGRESSAPTTAGDAPPQVILTPALPTAWPVILSAAPGLSDEATTAIGYRLVNGGISGAQVAGALGAVFGATGAPVTVDGTWVVGTAGGPTVTVDDDPLVSWRFEDPTASSEPSVSPAPIVSPAPTATPPLSSERALELATLLLGSIGVDTTAVDWQVDLAADSAQVTAWQLVAGARTQLAWRVGFDPAGAVTEASGFSAGFEQVPEYSVVGAATAVQRSGEPAWTAIPPRLISAPLVETPAATPSAGPSSDLPGLTVPVIDVTVTGAELGLAQYWQPDGGLLILPAYRLAGEDGSAWSILAVSDEYVSFAGQPYPASG